MRLYKTSDLIFRQIMLALSCAVLYCLCINYYPTNSFLAEFLPVSGFAIAAILLNKQKYLIGIFSGVAVAQLFFGHTPVWIVFLSTIGGLIEAMIGAWLLRKYKNFDLGLNDLRSFYYLCLVCITIPAISSFFFVVTLPGRDNPFGPAFIATIHRHWLGDSLAIILFTSLILVWRTPLRNWNNASRAMEFCGIFLLSLFVGQVVFCDLFKPLFSDISFGYWMFLIVLISAIRLGRHGVTVVLIVTANQAMLGAHRHTGFFANDIQNTHLVGLWTYIATLTLVGMTFSILLRGHKNNEYKLLKSEGQLLTTQQLAGIGSWTWDLQSGVHWWSDDIYVFYGRDPAQGPAVYPEVQMYFTAESWATLTAKVEKCLHTGSSYECDAEIIQRDGSHRWVVARGQADHDASGKLIGLHGTVQDISARMTIQLQLASSESNFRTLFENSPTAMLAVQPITGRILQCNGNAVVLWGYPAEELLTLGILDITHPDDMLSSQIRIDETASGGFERNFSVEKRYKRKNGAYFWAEASVSIVQDDSGRGIYCIASIIDISERKKIEQELRQLSRAVEQSPESIEITNTDAVIEYVNEALVKRSGYAREELIGKKSRILQSGKTPRATYVDLWTTLKRGEVWQGEFINRTKDGVDYTDHAIISPIREADGTVTHYVAVKEDITEKLHSKKQIHRLAYFDEVTELPNFVMLKEHISQSILKSRQSGSYGALMALNIDRFKMVNDANGQSLCNVLLKSLGERLVHTLHTTDVVSRTSGDEFCILLPYVGHNLQHAAHLVMQVAQKIHACMHAPFQINGKEIILTACHGIALFSGTEVESPFEILRRANTALHHAKLNGCGQSVFFEDSLEQIVKQRFALESDLRHAIKNGELQVYLQSQVDGRARIVGAEALVRWQHPRDGMISPFRFIPIAEETNLIVEIDNWVLTEVCRMIANTVVATLPLRFSVNISARHFRQPDFVSQIEQILTLTDANPNKLTLEVTEGIVIGDIDDVILKMKKLSAMGIQFSMDDFGTGYSSLSYLKRLPIHELKIDKSFIQEVTSDTNDAALVEVILAVARHLKLDVVAEGVETQAQADFLNQRARVLHQGYLYSRPEPMHTWLTLTLVPEPIPEPR